MQLVLVLKYDLKIFDSKPRRFVLALLPDVKRKHIQQLESNKICVQLSNDEFSCNLVIGAFIQFSPGLNCTQVQKISPESAIRNK